jgi:spermidine synthase
MPSAKLTVGVIGLGAGTMAAYGRKNDVIRFYEINPDVERLAREHFHYLADSPANVSVILGDARVALENWVRGGGGDDYDVFVVDAFSGDAIPTHLLTRECFDLYRRVLHDDGLLVLHVSNDHVDLTPVVRGLAAELGWQVRFIQSTDDAAAGTQRSDWLIATANQVFLDDPRVSAHFRPLVSSKEPIVWTDDFGSLRQVLK